MANVILSRFSKESYYSDLRFSDLIKRKRITEQTIFKCELSFSLVRESCTTCSIDLFSIKDPS